MKQFDKFNSPPLSFTDASGFSGVISLSTYVFLLAYLVWYIVDSLSGSFPTSSQSVVFPQRSTKTDLSLPPMHCVANSGCWYIPFVAEGASALQGGTNPGDKECYYLNKGETMPAAHRTIFHDSDPVDSFTALWVGSNFGFSYDVTKVTSHGLKLDTETVVGPKDLQLDPSTEGDPRFLLYKGASLFNLIRTQGIDGEKVDTWTNTVSSEDGSPDDQQNICCSADQVVHATTGDVLSQSQYIMKLGAGITRCSNTQTNQQGDSNSGNVVAQVKVRPLPTYTEVVVENPIHPLTVFSVLGGALGSFDLIASWVAWAVPRASEEVILKR